MSFKEQRGQDSALEISFVFLGLLSRTLQIQLPRSNVNTDGTETASLYTLQLNNVLLAATYEAKPSSRAGKRHQCLTFTLQAFTIPGGRKQK